MRRYFSATTAIFAAQLLALGACASRASPPASEPDPSEMGPTIRVVDPFERPALRTPVTPAPVPVPHDATFACAANEDCVVLELGCCDRCSPGSLLAINTQYKEVAESYFRGGDCSEAACGTADCAVNYSPVCDVGTCARLERDPIGRAADELSVVHNWFLPE